MAPCGQQPGLPTRFELAMAADWAGSCLSCARTLHRRLRWHATETTTRPAARATRDLARGPGRLGDAVGLRHPLHDGIDAITGRPLPGAVARLSLRVVPHEDVATGPRVGVAGEAGTALFPWRFWIAGDPTVSAFRWGRGAQSAEAAAVKRDTPSVLD